MLRSKGTGRRRFPFGTCEALCFIGVSLVVFSSIHSGAVFADEATATSTKTAASSRTKPQFRTELVRGKVVWQADALKDEFGISTVPEVAENVLAILTVGDELLPIVENVRGRAFRKDERLRGQDMELFVRRYDRQPSVQIIRVYQVEDDQRFEVDYWCDVCSIVMFETGPCSCCQDDNRLRKRPVDKDDPVRRPLPEDSAD